MSFWYAVCPKCYGQGRLVIVIDELKNTPFFNCDECESSWYSVSSVQSEPPFLGYKVKNHIASENEIEEFGWQKFALHRYKR